MLSPHFHAFCQHLATEGYVPEPRADGIVNLHYRSGLYTLVPG